MQTLLLMLTLVSYHALLEQATVMLALEFRSSLVSVSCPWSSIALQVYPTCTTLRSAWFLSWLWRTRYQSYMILVLLILHSKCRLLMTGLRCKVWSLHKVLWERGRQESKGCHVRVTLLRCSNAVLRVLTMRRYILFVVRWGRQKVLTTRERKEISISLTLLDRTRTLLCLKYWLRQISLNCLSLVLILL